MWNIISYKYNHVKYDFMRFWFYDFSILWMFFGQIGTPGLWTQELDAGLWTLGSGRWILDSGLSTLESGRWTFDATLWTLGFGHWTLPLTVLEQNQKPISAFAWLNYWKFFGCECLRTSWSRLLYRDYRFWLGYFYKFYIYVKCYVIKECRKKSLLWEIELHYLELFRSSRPESFIFFYRYYYTTTSKLKITITRHHKILAERGNKKNM